MREFLWFTKASWYFLGCGAGPGRWKARWDFLLGVIPASIRYARHGWSAKLIKEGKDNGDSSDSSNA